LSPPPIPFNEHCQVWECGCVHRGNRPSAIGVSKYLRSVAPTERSKLVSPGCIGVHDRSSNPWLRNPPRSHRPTRAGCDAGLRGPVGNSCDGERDSLCLPKKRAASIAVRLTLQTGGPAENPGSAAGHKASPSLPRSLSVKYAKSVVYLPWKHQTAASILNVPGSPDPVDISPSRYPARRRRS